MASADVSASLPWYRSLSKPQWSALIGSNLGWVFDGYETYALILVVGAALRQLLDPSEYARIPAYAGTVVALTLLGWAIGGLLGGIIADRLRRRFPGSYFLVSGWGMVVAAPIFVVSLYIPFPAAWIVMFVAIFFLFLNTGPSNTALANVSLPAVRATAFAANIFVIHALGDVQAFWLLGYIGGHSNIRTAFLFVSGIMLASGIAWLFGVQHLPVDTERVERATAAA